MRTPLIVLAVLLVAFTSADAISPNQVAKRMEQARAHNRAGLNRLSIGMDKKTVLETMGTETVKAGGYATITNPYRSEILISADAKTTLEVLLYYTDKKRADNAITDDELTPLVLKEGKLIGWGWSFINQTKQIYEIRIR